jgi:hypothetical protein
MVGTSHPLLGLAEKVFDERRYVGRTLTQRRRINRHYGNSIEKVLPESACGNLLKKIAIGSCNHAHVN